MLLAEGIDSKKIALPMLDETVILRSGTVETAKIRPRLSGEELSRDDWHNLYAGTITALSEKLRSVENDAQRRDLLEKVLRDIASV